MGTRIVVEVAPKRSFASALDWPGWSRGGRTPEAAVEALVAYAPRYARVAERAGHAFAVPRSTDELGVVEEVAGGGGTEFGVPGVPAAAEEEPLGGNDLERLVALLRAARAEFDAIADAARGRQLRTGPRGGGRDLDRIIEHVHEAEVGYLGQLGSRPPRSDDIDAVRTAFVDSLEARVTGRPIADPRRAKRPWSPRYAVRRAAWHVLDHAWEIEDRAEG